MRFATVWPRWCSTVTVTSPGLRAIPFTPWTADTRPGGAVKGPESRKWPGGPSSCEYSGSGINVVHLNVIPLSAANAGMYKAMCAQKSKKGSPGSVT